MTDTNPLAPIEALVIREERRVWQSMMPLTLLAWVTVRELRDALAEAREEVEGLVAERDAAREALSIESDLCECDRPDEGDNPHRHLLDVACVYWIAGRPTPERRRAAAEGQLPLTQPATDEEAGQ